VWGNEILLCRRAIEPRYGKWTLPAGFMEVGETTADGALRETLEEAAMLHVKGARAASLTQDDLFALRTRLTTDPGALRAFLADRDLLLDLDALHPLARWVTPEAESRRYDARFFIAVAPAAARARPAASRGCGESCRS